MTYTIGIERGHENWFELEPNYKAHFAETKASRGNIGEYNPRVDKYYEFFAAGWLVNYVARFNGEAVGHANVYITHCMHTSDLIAREDMIYVTPKHRNGLGKRLTRFVLDDLKARGVKRAYISARTDWRAEKLWQRMGFRKTSVLMEYDLETYDVLI